MPCFAICTLCNESSHQGVNTLTKFLQVNNQLQGFGTQTCSLRAQFLKTVEVRGRDCPTCRLLNLRMASEFLND